MFEHLDDPDPRGRPTLLAVIARGATIRRRRRVRWIGGAVVASLAVVVPGVMPRTEITPLPLLSPTPLLSPAPLLSPTPLLGDGPPTPSPTSRPSPMPEPGMDPDGRPGWSGGFSGCVPGERMASVAPSPGLTIRFRLDRPAFRAGETVTGKLHVTNAGTDRVAFQTADAGDDGTLLDDAGHPLTGRHWSDVIEGRRFDLAPGESATYAVTIRTAQCGDTSADAGRPVAPGRYWVHALLWWSADADQPYLASTWYAPAVRVEIA